MKDKVIEHIEKALRELQLQHATQEIERTKSKLYEALLWYEYGCRLPSDQGW